MSCFSGPEITDDNLVMSIDFANRKNFNPTTNVVVATALNDVTWERRNPEWISFLNNAIVFTRNSATSLSVADKNFAGGCIKTTGNLFTVATASATHYHIFYYNDHTFEVWFQINNSAPSNYDATEVVSTIAGHSGYDNGFSYSANFIDYVVWNGSSGGNTIFSWSVGASSEVRPNQWHQVVATRSGNTWRKYLDGKYVSETTQNPAVNPLIYGLGDISIGSTWENNANFQYYSVSTISNVKMYNRSLSNTEIFQNFNALRSRFGI